MINVTSVYCSEYFRKKSENLLFFVIEEEI